MKTETSSTNSKPLEKFELASKNITSSLEVMKQEFMKFSQQVNNHSNEELEALKSRNINLQKEIEALRAELRAK